MQTTTNYALKKIELTDSPPDITVLNSNFDTIDTQLKSNANAAGAAIPKSLATAADQVLVSSGIGVWAVKTLAQFKTWLGLGSAAYTASTAYATAAQGATADTTASNLTVHLANDTTPHKLKNQDTGVRYYLKLDDEGLYLQEV